MIAPPRHHHRRGAALLIVLAAVALTITAVAGLAMRAATVSLARTQDHAIQNADELALAADAAIEHWLLHDASTVVLPLDVITPEVHILHQAWELNGLMAELRVAAWDQDGMMPLQNPPWPVTLPEPIRTFLSATDLERLRASSLEQLFATEATRQQSVYPLPNDATPTWIGVESASPAPSGSKLHSLNHVVADRPALGAFLASSRVPSGRPTRNRTLRLNVNTAPLPLLEAAMRDVGRGGLDAIRAARLNGRPATPGAAPDGESPGQTPGMKVQLVSVSQSWAFRIDVAFGHVTRSWWLVIARDGNEWRVVDRHVIAE